MGYGDSQARGCQAASKAQRKGKEQKPKKRGESQGEKESDKVRPGNARNFKKKNSLKRSGCGQHATLEVCYVKEPQKKMRETRPERGHET